MGLKEGSSETRSINRVEVEISCGTKQVKSLVEVTKLRKMNGKYMVGKKSFKKIGQYIAQTELNSKPGIFNDSNWKILSFGNFLY